MLIELTDEWMGHKAGSQLNLISGMGKSLIARGVAVEINSKNLVPMSKDIGDAPADKMIHKPENKKLFRRKQA